jgi:hypothetical protein
MIEAEAVERAKKEAEKEARVQSALAAPDADWLTGKPPHYYTVQSTGEIANVSGGELHGRPVVDTSPLGLYLEEEQKADPRIVARRAEVESSTLPTAIAEWEAKYAEWEAACTARRTQEAEEASAKEAARAAMREWASTCVELPARIRRAASDGLDVYPAVKRHLGDSVRACLRYVAGALGGDVVDTYSIECIDRVPSDEAYAIFDALTAAKDRIVAAAIVPGVTVTVGPFVRADIAEKGHAVWRSAVDVTVSHPWFGDLGDHVLTEPVAPEEDDEDER